MTQEEFIAFKQLEKKFLNNNNNKNNRYPDILGQITLIDLAPS